MSWYNHHSTDKKTDKEMKYFEQDLPSVRWSCDFAHSLAVMFNS